MAAKAMPMDDPIALERPLSQELVVHTVIKFIPPFLPEVVVLSSHALAPRAPEDGHDRRPSQVALLTKNYHLSLRNKRATCARRAPRAALRGHRAHLC